MADRSLVVGDGDQNRQLVLPEQLGDLDGWEEAELVAWASDTTRFIDQGEQLLEEARLAVGLVLYKLRQEVGDGRYGLLVAEMADRVGSSVRSLQRWRLEAQEHHRLPAPDARSEGRQRQLQGDATVASPAEPERVTPSEVIPPQPEPERRGKKPAAAPAAFQQLALPLEEAASAIQEASLADLVQLPDEQLAALAARIAEAQRAKRRLSGATEAPSCAHPKAMHETLSWGTVCSPKLGGCGAKIR